MIRIRDITNAVADFYMVPVDAMLSRSQYRAHTRPRQVAMCLAVRLTRHSKSRVGYFFDRDHSTVGHALCAVERDELARAVANRLARELETAPCE